jgi:hypothetical protein
MAPTAASPLDTPPVPPGALAVSPTPHDTLAFLEALDQWSAALHSTLASIDAASQQASNPAAYTGDVTLAMSLSQSISARRDELVTTWDSGRVGPDELAKLAVLMWGRLPDPLGAPSAFTLSEACTLVAALTDRLTTALSADAIAGSGVADRIDAVRAAIERCRSLAAALAVPTTHLDELGARMDDALASKDRDRIASTVTATDTEVTGLERDLIKEAGLRTNTARLLAAVQARRTELEARAATVTALAERCRSRITNPPRLAVPEVDALGPPPATPPTAASADDASTQAAWAAARDALTAYGARLDRCTAALDEAEQRYGQPLQARDDQRGLLDAYRDRANRAGFAEDPALTTAYLAAHAVLWSAPCDLEQAGRLVEEYQHAVRVAVGADHADALPATDAVTPPSEPSQTSEATP